MTPTTDTRKRGVSAAWKVHKLSREGKWIGHVFWQQYPLCMTEGTMGADLWKHVTCKRCLKKRGKRD